MEALKKVSLVFVPVLILVLLLSLGYLDFQRNKKAVLDAATSTAVNRASLLNHYISLMSEKVSSLVLSFQSEYAKAIKTPESGVDLSTLKRDSEIFRLYGELDYLSGVNLPLYSFLTGRLSLDTDSPRIKAELTAALGMDSRFESILDNLDHPEWVYYVSKNGFKLIAPNALDFSEADYQRTFFDQASPENNPDGFQIITDLYSDDEGKGLMVTISEPIFIEDEFIGVVSIDVGIQLMLDVLVSGDAPGETIVFDEKGYIVAKTGSLGPNQRIDFEFNSIAEEVGKGEDAIQFAETIYSGELYLAHKITQRDLTNKAIYASFYSWVLLLLAFLMLILFIFWLREAKRNEHLMSTDPMTGLMNRRGFGSMLEPIKAHLIRAEHPCGILIIDIDKFKNINDNFGHNVGDEVIAAVATVLKSCLRADSLCCRWGGEEFLVYLPGAEIEVATSVAERIREAIEQEPLSTENLLVTASIGVFACDADTELMHMASKADEALYQAKLNGRNRVEVAS